MGLKKKEIDKFRDVLLEKKRKILDKLIKDSARYHEIFKNSGEGDLADIANESYEKYLLYDLSIGEKGELEAVDEALRKVEEGSYGRCESCEEEIPVQQLMIKPDAKLCVKCKEKAEKAR
jgi:RNA polymerase-binding protein DksA